MKSLVGLMETWGSILDREYIIEVEGKRIAKISKTVSRDTYGVEIDPGKYSALILTIADALDQMGT